MRRASLAVAAGLLATMGLRIGVAEVLIRRDVQLPDSQLYEAYAASLYEGGPYSDGKDGARRAPGYPAYLAATWTLGGCDPFDQEDPQRTRCRRATLWLQATLSILACGAVYGISSRWVDDGTFPNGSQYWATAAAALDPYATVLAGMQLSESLFTTIAVITLWIGQSLGRMEFGRRTAFAALAMGVTAAFGVLVRPSSALLAPLALVAWAVTAPKGTRKRILAFALVASAGFALAMSPWVVRNAIKYGRFIPTALNAGESLYDGWNPKATGASDMYFTDDPRAADLSEPERDDYWRRQALQWAAGEPGKAIELAGIKFLRFWSPWPNEPRFRTPAVTAVTTAATVPVFLAAVFGSVRQLRRRTEAERVRRRQNPDRDFGQNRGSYCYPNRFRVLTACWLPAVYFCGLHMLFVSSVRYRVPAMPFLHLIAGAGFAVAAGWMLKFCCRSFGSDEKNRR